MRVTYFGEQGNVRKVYTNIAALTMYDMKTVELVHIIKHAQPVPDVIHLAPGEYLEWSADAERD